MISQIDSDLYFPHSSSPLLVALAFIILISVASLH